MTTKSKWFGAVLLIVTAAFWQSPSGADQDTVRVRSRSPRRVSVAPRLPAVATVTGVPRAAATPAVPPAPRPFIFFRREPRDIDRKLSASPRGTITIVNPAGSVVITGSERNEVHVTGTLGGGVRKMIFTRDGDEVNLEVVPREMYPLGDPCQLEIELPSASRLDIKTFSATIEVKGITGTIDMESMNGDITVADAPRLLHAECVSCNMELEGAAEVVRAETVNGSIRVARGRGFVELSTVSGTLEIEGDKVDEVTMSAVSGTIHFRGIPGRNGSLMFQTHSGPIELDLPGDLAADFEIVNYNGRVESQLGRIPLSRAGAENRELHFSTGSGGARIKAETFSGSIDITKH